MATDFQKEKAGMVIHAAARAAVAAAAMWGATPIAAAYVAADTVCLSGIHIKMIRDLGEIFGQNVDEQSAMHLLGFATSAGIGIGGAKKILYLFPGLGTIANASVSAAYTEAMGWWCFKYFDDKAHAESHA